MKKNVISIICGIFLFGALHGQPKSVIIQFVPYYNNEPLVLAQNWYTTPNGEDSITIDLLKMYIGNINFEGYTKKVKNNYYLINASNEKTMQIAIPSNNIKSFKHLSFSVGVDSITSSKGILNGSLDPLNGMYWTWNTGYIQAKLEGKCIKCKAFSNKYLFHIGGFKHPFNTQKKIKLPINSTLKQLSKIVIKVDLAHWLKNIDFTQQVSIMQPSSKAMEMANNFTNSFTIINYQ